MQNVLLTSRALASAAIIAACTSLAAQPAADNESRLEIDLATAVRLADERNVDVAIFLARIEAATARLNQARLMAVPSLRVGATDERHEGNIQETSGNVIDADRASQFSGASAALGLDIADAIFRPLVARQSHAAIVAASAANRQQVLMQVASAYVRLLQARAELAVIGRAHERAVDLARLTADYAESGEGLPADAEMAAVQPALWEQRRAAADERVVAANAELVRMLRLDAQVELAPVETEPPAVEIFSGTEDVAELIARAQDGRPENEQAAALVAAAEGDLAAERYGWFVPSVSLNISAGEFGGGPGSAILNTDDRYDRSLTLYWKFDGLGFGQHARVVERRAQLQELTLRREKLRDAIAAEVRESHARVVSLKRQIELADMAIEHARRAYELNRTRIFDQQGLPLEALQAMQTLASAELGALEVRTGLSIAQLRLHTALGNPVVGIL
ncbi:MAG TPA: TolC family protein [Gammaproteobacteria bacterium]|nr:TolC family protein [Gammaproteobacteria bacterium]